MGADVYRDADRAVRVVMLETSAGVKFLPWESAHLALNLPTPLLVDPQAGAFQWGRGEFRRTMLMPYVLLGLWAVTMAWTPRRQSVHDLVAGTIVRTA
jgi:hypothetical protein